ncbi:hypothetical protein OG462_42185 [Streptomyces sp. NBC_01077]|uniref:hypothetical protein n=1 Tax=Streptomyces sp. NBC_01077 TaxID=2903746 RepID=UPI003868686A|nr:hypothetical protein OG462_02835 [Streptomyces sp. NBC_01077]WSV43472.1 hypothetical protein OG462_42185 [Streptomyces sp. NBC_01077]
MKIDEKRQAILDSSGHLLIEGGPGCGKTTIALLKAQQYAPHARAGTARPLPEFLAGGGPADH